MNGTQLREFRKQLLTWFREFQRPLPWRKSRDPYGIWISEIMLQQTRVAAAIPYYERFLERFPDVQALAEAPQEEVLRMWSGLGYYSRARNLQKAAQQMVALHKGEFPHTWEAASSLPGIGDYTAAAILSIAFGEKDAVLDGNVARVLARLEAVRGDLRETKRWRELQKTAEKVLDPTAPGDWNQAMMELGAMVCTPRSPQCLLCPVSRFCKARKLGLVERIPEKRAKRTAVEVTLVAAIFMNARGETLLLPPPSMARKRDADDVPSLVSRMWHFPTLSAAKDPLIALRELIRIFKIAGKAPMHALCKVRHTVTYRKVSIFPFRILVRKLPGVQGSQTIPLHAVSSCPVSNLTRKIAQAALE
ncbi:MAG TPA: A/G-specific adenine glycosylase [Candidatus Acidoferrum sp.]|nr:A/G-specific adenine glycosylase [Candidatus Acidoferrum sp.]